jgi:hypothetical protein
MSPTREQLLAFIKRRNASPYMSNLQFEIDARECGFRAQDLGDPEVLDDETGRSYVWDTPHGRLVERVGGKLSLEEGQP